MKDTNRAKDSSAVPPCEKTARTLGEGIERLDAVVARLRAPDGCPWDKVQTLESLKPCLMEECYELLEKMASNDLAGHKEELGDVLLQIVFQAGIRRDRGEFSLLDAINAVCDKLVRRHPHVFAGRKVDGVGDVLANWESIKKSEGVKGDGGAPKSALAGVPANLPSLLKAQRVQAKAARGGYEPLPKAESRRLVGEALSRVDAAAAASDGTAEAKDGVKREFGRLVFALAAYARFLDIDAETALKNETDAFAEKFLAVEGRGGGAGR